MKLGTSDAPSGIHVATRGTRVCLNQLHTIRVSYKSETCLVSDHDFLLLLLGAVIVQFGYPYMGDGGGYVVFYKGAGCCFLLWINLPEMH